MKRILSLLIVLCTILGLNVTAIATELEVDINLGSPKFSQKQGDNGWYFCEHSSGIISELEWSDDISGWTSSGDVPPRILKNELLPGATKDLCFKFVPNQGGLYSLSWDIAWIYGADRSSDGMRLTVLNNGELLWDRDLKIAEPSDCKVTVMLEAGDVVEFRANCKKNRAYDSFTGFPKVELVGIFYQKDETGMKKLSRSKISGMYVADDMLARISSTVVMPTQKYSLVRRYIIPQDGRFRIYGNVSSNYRDGSNIIIKIYKNNEIVRELLCLSGEETLIDVRMLCNKNDFIDIEAGIHEYEGFNYSNWDLKIESIPGTVRDCETTTTGGYQYNKLETQKISDMLSNHDSYDIKLYTEVKGVKYPMDYNSSSKKWEETSVDKTGVTRIPKASRETLEEYIDRITINDAGYVTATEVAPTANWESGSNTRIEVPVKKDGCMLLSGRFVLPSEKDAELVKVYVNDECVWSNRIGGETSIKFDEPYDTKYFIDNINALVNVKIGDTISFVFSKWRKHIAGETINISDISLSYIEGNILSKQTKWKIDNSIVVDTVTGKIYVNGEYSSNNANIQNGTTYILPETAAVLFGYVNETGAEKVALRTVAENSGKTVVWAANRYVIVHNGIPGMYTWNELSEISAYSEIAGGVLYE